MPPRTTRIGSRFLKASTNPSPARAIAAVAQSVTAPRVRTIVAPPMAPRPRRRWLP
jgi:hypothetical protein